MIYITGDTHGQIDNFVNGKIDDKGWGKDDYLIICGDFGFVFLDDESESEELDYLATKPYTICFADGNHENFHKIFSYPQEEWNGGKVHRIRGNIVHLMRGQVFEIEGKKFFTMGGAFSIDRYMRRLNYSYWREELPNDAEYREAVKNLENNNFEVDIVISHTAPTEIIRRFGRTPDAHEIELTGFLEWVMYKVKHSHWYFGHWHLDTTIDNKYTAVYLDVHSI